ncbi:single-stranded DNA-binding protein [Jeotgalibaca caeni]|uniref:single-stranded DNA-binding protein n=1 Tax=Jeotgalibaca caeni TaxID=3028623 RepID=UPI00237DE6A7|nr:single-stranded DNA-binding protein [Jeotgalibaca caeni]MDE1547708.1 single-stranded DNA-binding protein [Jeotgalibaca caeni]
MNHVSLLGRLVRSVEVQEVGHGRFVSNNTLAVQRLGKKEEGQQQADFIPVVFWDKTAHLLKEYCGKGSLIGLNGKLASRSYLNKQEQQVFVVELVVESLHFVEPKKKVEPPIEVPF